MGCATFCEGDYAVTPRVKEFWNVLTAVGGLGFYAWKTWPRRKRGPGQSWSGDVLMVCTTILWIEGVVIHAVDSGRWLPTEFAAVAVYATLFLETGYVFPLVSTVVPMFPRLLKLFHLTESTSVLNTILSTPEAPAFEALAAPLLCFVAAPALHPDMRVFFRYPLTVAAISIQLLSLGLARFLEAKGVCHFVHSGIPIIDEFFTPHLLFDHLPIFADYQFALLLDCLTTRGKKIDTKLA